MRRLTTYDLGLLLCLTMAGCRGERPAVAAQAEPLTVEVHSPSATRIEGAAEGDGFGAAIAIDGPTAVVGAPGAGPSRAGRVHVLEADATGWHGVTVLAPSTITPGARFGAAVALDGDLAVVGAPHDNGGAGADQGAVYVYRRVGRTWTEEARLERVGGAAGDEFGAAVATSMGRLLVGAPGAIGLHRFETERGAAHVYRNEMGTWVHEASLRHVMACWGDCCPTVDPSDCTEVAFPVDDRLGSAVTFHNGDALAGAPGVEFAIAGFTRGESNAENRGAVATFRLGPDGWAQISLRSVGSHYGPGEQGRALASEGDA